MVLVSSAPWLPSTAALSYWSGSAAEHYVVSLSVIRSSKNVLILRVSRHLNFKKIFFLNDIVQDVKAETLLFTRFLKIFFRSF